MDHNTFIQDGKVLLSEMQIQVRTVTQAMEEASD